MTDVSSSRAPPVLELCEIVRPSPAATRVLLRGSPEALAAAAGALGLQDIERPCRAASRAGRAALWLGPDERLVLGNEGDGLIELLERALAALPHSLVEISHALTAFEVAGPDADTVLNAGCPLDLDAAAFPVGMCTRTVFAKAQIVLWRTDLETFRVEVARSLGSYVSKIMALAASERSS